MLKPEDNELLTQVGPDTAMGELLRRFWMPALLESEIAEADGAPVRLRLLGEDLVAFRDTEGRLGVLEAHCAHRRAHLYFGRNRDNDYGFDRRRQREVNYAGILGIPNQDAAVQESMGPIADRSRETLGTSDKAIIAYRRLLLDMAEALQGGQEPAAARDGSRYNVRSASVLLEQNVPFVEGAARLLSARSES